VNPRVEQYVRHAKRFGDPQAVYATAATDRLSGSDLGYLAARLGRLDPKREANHFRSGPRRERWPKFRLSRGQKVELVGRLLDEGVPPKTIATYVQSTVRWVFECRSDLIAEAECVELLRAGPVDLREVTVSDPSLYGRLRAILGYGVSSAKSTPDRLSTSGIGGEIVTAGLRFERLTVLRIDRDASGRKVAVCRCDCGAETTAKPSHLVRGEKRSCGCLRRERMAAMKRPTPEVPA
jgi:hypothetical protein